MSGIHHKLFKRYTEVLLMGAENRNVNASSAEGYSAVPHD